ncbi:MAG: hypothetical protein V2A71_04690, partial [Candidatus Eisenbacteria bacterium]
VTYRTTSFECKECPNLCEVVKVLMNNSKIAGWGDRCGRYQSAAEETPVCEECLAQGNSR